MKRNAGECKFSQRSLQNQSDANCFKS